MTTEETAVQNATTTAPVADNGTPEGEEEEGPDAREEANAGLKALAALQKLADKFGHRIREGEKKAALARWDAGKAFLPAVNAYCHTTGSSRKDAIDAIGIRMRAATGDSKYDVESDIRFGVLMEHLSEGGDKELKAKLSDVAYRLLVPLRQLVVALTKSDTELFRYDLIPHVEDQVLRLRDELLGDQSGPKAPRVLRDDKVNLKVKGILSQSCERQAASVKAAHEGTLSAAGLDIEELEEAILSGDDKALSAAVDAISKLEGGTPALGNEVVMSVREKVHADGKATEHRKAAEKIQAKLDGTRLPVAPSRPAAVTAPATPADTQKAFEAELKTLSGNDSATEYRARCASTLIGKSVDTAVATFEMLPGELMGDSEFMEPVLDAMKTAKVGTLIAILRDMAKADGKFGATLGLALGLGKRSESVLPNVEPQTV